MQGVSDDAEGAYIQRFENASSFVKILKSRSSTNLLPTQ
jgi:hypothetical protein